MSEELHKVVDQFVGRAIERKLKIQNVLDKKEEDTKEAHVG